MSDTRPPPPLKLRLYIIGQSDHSKIAEQNLQALMKGDLNGARVEVIDVLDDPEQALRDRITTAPVLIRLAPEPRIMLLGDLTNRERVLDALGIAAQANDE